MAAIYKRHRLSRAALMTSSIDDVTTPSLYQDDYRPSSNDVSTLKYSFADAENNNVNYKETCIFDEFDLNSEKKEDTQLMSSPENIKSTDLFGSFCIIDSDWKSKKQNENSRSSKTEQIQCYQLNASISDRRILEVEVEVNNIEYANNKILDQNSQDNEISSEVGSPGCLKIDFSEIDELISLVNEQSEESSGNSVKNESVFKSGGFYTNESIDSTSSESENENFNNLETGKYLKHSQKMDGLRLKIVTKRKECSEKPQTNEAKCTTYGNLASGSSINSENDFQHQKTKSLGKDSTFIPNRKKKIEITESETCHEKSSEKWPIATDRQNNELKLKINLKRVYTGVADFGRIPPQQSNYSLNKSEKNREGKLTTERIEDTAMKKMGTEMRLAMEFPRHNWLAKHLEEKLQGEDLEHVQDQGENDEKGLVSSKKQNVFPVKTEMQERKHQKYATTEEEIENSLTTMDITEFSEDNNSSGISLSAIATTTVQSITNEGSHMVGIVKPYQYSNGSTSSLRSHGIPEKESNESEKVTKTEDCVFKNMASPIPSPTKVSVQIDRYFSLAENKTDAESPLDLSTTKFKDVNVLDLSNKKSATPSSHPSRCDKVTVLTRSRSVPGIEAAESVSMENKPISTQPRSLLSYFRKKQYEMGKKTNSQLKETFRLAQNPPSKSTTTTTTTLALDIKTPLTFPTQDRKPETTDIIDVDALEDKTVSRHNLSRLKSGKFYPTTLGSTPKSFHTFPNGQMPVEFIQLQSGELGRHNMPNKLGTYSGHHSNLSRKLTNDGFHIPPNSFIRKPPQSSNISPGRLYSRSNQRPLSSDFNTRELVNNNPDRRVIRSVDSCNGELKNNQQHKQQQQANQIHPGNMLYHQQGHLRQRFRSVHPQPGFKNQNVVVRPSSVSSLNHNTNVASSTQHYQRPQNIIRAPPGGVSINSTPLSLHAFDNMHRRRDLNQRQQAMHMSFRDRNFLGNGDMRLMQQPSRLGCGPRDVIRPSDHKDMKRKLDDPREMNYINERNMLLNKQENPSAAKSRKPGKPMNKEDLCRVCYKQAYFVCSGCKSNWYCSKQCQFLDWTTHSKICL